jgi:hypothetical protein
VFASADSPLRRPLQSQASADAVAAVQA